MHIASLKGYTGSDLFPAFSEAFSDYPVQIGEALFLSMIRRRAYAPELSFAAFEGKRIVSFILHGTGFFDGQMTAYDLGTGTVPEYRGKKLSAAIFAEALPRLKEAGMSCCLLEVLKENEKAISIYRKTGFTVSREVNYYVTAVKDIPVPETDHRQAEPIPFDEIRSQDPVHFTDFLPTWQNTLDAVARDTENYLFFGVHRDKKLAGYAIFDPVSGDLSQLAVARPYRGKGIATALFAAALRSDRNEVLKVLNVESDSPALNTFLRKMGMEVKGQQYEMRYSLS